MRFALMTQNDCANCERLKLMLDKPLRGQFSDQIETVHRQEQPERFEALTQAHALMRTPALINLESGAVLLDTQSLHEVKRFLSS